MKCALLGLLLLTSLAQAGTITYRQSDTGPCPTERCDELGYPVPLPVESQTPVDGFRSHAALHARLQNLALASDRMERRTVGMTRAGRPIDAYILSDADAFTPGGFAEPALLQNGGIHAREWASPEVVAAIAERLMQFQGDGGLHRYLLDTAQIILLPTLNVDGFLQTQRYPAAALENTFAEDPSDWPRDGRMRRKNMRRADGGAVDEDLATTGDFLLGTDNNRNNDPYFNSDIQNSDVPESLVFHGPAAGSEAENQALYAAAALGPVAHLRYFVDTHSFSRVYFGLNTGNSRRDALTRALHGTMTAVADNRYGYDPSPAGNGIGSTDEYFGLRYQIPSYTLELEPGPNGSAEYGGAGVTHDGFILPASEIGRVREEMAAASLAGMYRMAGPPSVAAVQIRERSGGRVVFAGAWQRLSESSRRFEVSARSPLANDVDYELWLAFDKPMRVRGSGGEVAQFRGQSVPLAPIIALEGLSASGNAFALTLSTDATGWRAAPVAAPGGFLRYADDAYATVFRVPATTPLSGARRINLAIDVQDLSGQRLDANPASAADLAGGGWTRYEDSAGNAESDAGGVDRALRPTDDGSPLFGIAAPVPAASYGNSGGGGGPLLALPLLLACGVRARRARKRR